MPIKTSFAGFGGLSASYLTFYLALFVIASILLIIVVTLGVHRDACRLRQLGAGTLFFGPFGWAVVTFTTCLIGSAIGAVAVMATYWLIHHSTLRRDRPPAPIAIPRPPAR